MKSNAFKKKKCLFIYKLLFSIDEILRFAFYLSMTREC